MREKVIVGYKDWVGSTADELGYGVLEPASRVYTYTHEDGSAHNVLVVDGRKTVDDPTILKSASLNYRIDPLLLRRTAIEAARQQARIAIAELPGVSGLPVRNGGIVDYEADVQAALASVYQTKHETSEAAKGRFEPLAEKQLIAFSNLLSLKPGELVELHGESLGAMAVAALGNVIAHRKKGDTPTVARIHLADPANPTGLSAREFMSMYWQFSEETRRRNDIYLQENEEIGHSDVTAFERQSPEAAAIDAYVKQRQTKATLLPARGLRASMANVLRDAVTSGRQNGSFTDDTVVSIAHHADSKVGNQTKIEGLLEQLRSENVRTELYSYESDDDGRPLGHLALVSLGRTATASNHMAEKRAIL